MIHMPAPHHEEIRQFTIQNERDMKNAFASAYETHTQPRLFIGRFQLVQVPAPRHASTVWALPGGGRASTAQLLALARVRGWSRPRVIEVTVRYRAKGEG